MPGDYVPKITSHCSPIVILLPKNYTHQLLCSSLLKAEMLKAKMKVKVDFFFLLLMVYEIMYCTPKREVCDVSSILGIQHGKEYLYKYSFMFKTDSELYMLKHFLW